MSQVIIIGILLALLYTEFMGVSPGGLIVPAYFALYVGDPMRILATLVIALLCLGTVRVLSHVMILYGRRRYGIYVLAGLFYKALFGLLIFQGPAFFFSVSASIGYLIPGILGRDMERQGILKTIGSLAVVVAMIRLATIAAGLI